MVSPPVRAAWVVSSRPPAGISRSALPGPTCTLFVTAQERGDTLVSGNLRHMDLLLQIGGPASVPLYALPEPSRSPSLPG